MAHIGKTSLPVLAGVLLAWNPAIARETAVGGTWTGQVKQNSGASDYTAIMTLGASGGTSDYPELGCSGRLKRVGSAKTYVFYTETITRGGVADGGQCIDGTVTLARSGSGLIWGWVGHYDGEVYVAWSTMTRK